MFKRIAQKTLAILTALIILASAIGLAFALQLGTNKLPLRQYFPASQTNAIWDWSGPHKTDEQLSRLSEFMYLHQLNASYVDLGTYVAILQEPEGAKRTEDTAIFETALTRYIAALHKHNVQVYASAGDVNWSQLAHRATPVALLQFAHNYNQTHPNTQLAGFQFDIESYNQPGFAEGSMTEKSIVLTEYLDMVELLVDNNGAYLSGTTNKFALGFAIPYWFDNENGNIPAVNWHNKIGPTLYHLMDTLNRLPQGNVVVMAYRNAASGKDGVIAHARTEIDYAQSEAPHVIVMIGQEVTNVEPAKITYFGRVATEFSSQVGIIENEFKPTGVYGGIAINDLAGYRAMEGVEK